MEVLPTTPVAVVALVASASGFAFLVARRDIPKSYALGILILGVQLLQTFEIFFLGDVSILLELGFRSGPFLAGDQWWAPFSYLFVHADFLHLLGNMLLLVSVGPILEERIGTKWFFVVYLGAGFAAVVAHLGMTYLLPIDHPARIPPEVPAVGASGALFGLLTVLAWHWPREKIPMSTGFFLLWLPSIVVLGVYVALNLAFMYSSTGIAWYGHFAGFLAGLAVAPFLRPRGGPVSARRLPDPDALAPLATDDGLKVILERIRAMSGTTSDDPVYAEAWLDKFFAKATCPAGHALTRRGTRATCEGGEYSVDFGR